MSIEPANGVSNQITTSPDIVSAMKQLVDALPYHLADKIYMAVTIVGAFSLFASCLPNPLKKGDNLSKTKFGDIIRQSKVYYILYCTANVLAANVWWAKNFVHPSQRIFLDKLTLVYSWLKSNNVTVTNASEQPPELTVKSFNKDGSPILGDKDNNETFVLPKCPKTFITEYKSPDKTKKQ